jgi:hypothetical protein
MNEESPIFNRHHLFDEQEKAKNESRNDYLISAFLQ